MNAFLIAYKSETWKCPFRKLKSIFRGIKWSYQRAVRGYCDYDSWDIDHWFLGVTPKMLQQFATETNGYPNDFTFEQWRILIFYMAHLFENSNADELYETLGLEDYDHSKYHQCQDEANENLDKAFDLFRKYFHHLWW